MRNRSSTALGLSLAGLCSALVACSNRTDVSLTGNTPAQYSHVYITTQEVWFNTSATAGPDDGGWVQFPLTTPTTVDLVQANGGNLAALTTDLKLVAGTYSQIRVIPVDSTLALTSSAQGVGALYNAEADYVDSAGTTHQLPLELLNPDKGIGIQGSLKVPIGSVSAALSSSGVEAGTTTGTTTGTTEGTAIGVGTPSTTSTTSTTGTTTGSTTPNTEFAINVLGNSDLVQFSYGSSSTPGVMLSSHASAYDLSKVAGITGQLTLTNLSTNSTSGLPSIQATAETLSADGTRWVAVASTPVNADGTFLIYPLPSSDSTPVYYDVVIHGPGMATIIIESVDVELPSSSSTLTTSTTSTTGTTDTTGTTSTTGTSTVTGTTTTGTTTTGLSSSSSSNSGTATTMTTATTTTGTSITVAAASIGTLYPRAASYYSANLVASAQEKLPAGALIGFYETLGGAGQVPHLIEASSIDPFNQVLATPQSVSSGTIDSGTWTSTNANVTVVSAAPLEGGGGYTVSATAPSFASGPLTSSYRISAPSACSSQTTSTCTPTTPVTIPTLPALALASGTTSGTLSVAVHEASPGKYNQGELLVSENGQLIATASLNAVFATGAGGTVTVSGVPAETPTALYYLSVRAWNSSDPGTTLERQWFDTALDLRSSASGTSELTIN
jgi:hypothetical protein